MSGKHALSIALFSYFKLVKTIFERNISSHSVHKRIRTRYFGHFGLCAMRLHQNTLDNGKELQNNSNLMNISNIKYQGLPECHLRKSVWMSRKDACITSLTVGVTYRRAYLYQFYSLIVVDPNTLYHIDVHTYDTNSICSIQCR